MGLELFEHNLMLKCIDTGENEIVNLVEFTPRVALTIDFMPGTKFYRRITLQYTSNTDDYRTEVYGRTLMSRGPRTKMTNKVENIRNFNKKTTKKYKKSS